MSWGRHGASAQGDWKVLYRFLKHTSSVQLKTFMRAGNYENPHAPHPASSICKACTPFIFFYFLIPDFPKPKGHKCSQTKLLLLADRKCKQCRHDLKGSNSCPMEQMPLIWTCFASTLGFNQVCSFLSLSTVWHTVFFQNSPPPYYLTRITRHSHASNLPSTEQAVKTKPKQVFVFHFWPFICCLSVVLWLDKGDFPKNVHAVCPC